MNVRKLMGRLNAATCRFDIGRGGIPDLTPQDIAAALAMVEDPFAREVFCAVWWPDGAKLTSMALQSLLRSALVTEYGRRARELTAAKLDLHIIECEIAARRNVSWQDRNERAAAAAKVECLRKKQWPWTPAMYGRICAAAIEERRRHIHCHRCKGLGVWEATESSPAVECDACSGTGSGAITQVDRAKAIGINESAYRNTWGSAYEWTINLVSGMEAKAAKKLERALGEDLGEEAA
jgi:hypothetical protein